MGLSAVLEIAIGIIFIYLVLSLLSSEIQELLSTILQWRAVHLKESIEGLLAGNSDEPEMLRQSRELANIIYENPAIRDLNHEAKGFIASIPRIINHKIGYVLRLGNDGIFGNKQRSGPSYIGSNAFVNTLLETLHFDEIGKFFALYRLRDFLDNKLSNQSRELEEIYDDYEYNKFTLTETIARIATETKGNSPADFNQFFADDDGESISPQKLQTLTRKLSPNPSEVFRLILILRSAEVQQAYQKALSEINSENPRYAEIKRSIVTLPGLTNSMRKSLLLYAALVTNPEIAKVQKLPPISDRLHKRLYDLADQAQDRIKDTENQFLQFRADVENWFDNSMVRASGVYKRNARLVAVIVGFLIAVGANADTFHIVSRLSSDQTLRTAINASAEQVVTNDISDQGELSQETIDQLKQAADNLSLPIGWDQYDLTREKQRGYTITLPLMIRNGKISRSSPSLEPVSPAPANPASQEFMKISLITIAGWIITGLAVSMGASFWYDLLSKVINIKNVGSKPIPPENMAAEEIEYIEYTDRRK
ncbi:hypothetical protein Pse7367_0320 [Thalassoporum mexicanum PCC 7367]|uniref:hypothetical protein n=1 Tax=Thalassoporum mexicanum TaxID=3457544 RepID=UPI00029FFD54|nr:hypothetical protein [Pseudanabaena sp. PCC 7367]AFY68633.1 hypothetical protein Pse7367_0320 [Pseudanabaena sp. PCC 7367]